MADSLAKLRNQVQSQTAQLAQLRQSARQLESAQAAVRATRDSARRSMESLNFEKQLLKDTRAVRIYKFPVNDVRKVFTDNLNRDNAGFTLNNSSAGNTLIMSREFNQQAPAWWDVDREDDGRLDVTLRLVEHPYDNSRTVLYADTRLLKKDRTGNKPIQDQSDPEKLQLYRDRTIRLLEGFLRVASEK
ncbi:MAG: hypothetical protein EAZ91_14260 [Cytophagales bacterium]|nr:MAG: hypothetical protein EAZ91_14260 [Cytophagales bacterium]